MNRASAVLFTAILALGCSGVDVKRDYDASVDFGRMKTFAWQSPVQPQAPGDLANNTLLDERVRGAVNAVLSEKGYRETSIEKADFLVAYHYALEREAAVDRVRTGIGIGGGSGGAFGSLGIGLGAGAQDEEEETLTIDVLEAPGGKLLWRAFTQQRFTRTSDPQKAAATVKATVKAILSKFPPQPKRR